MVISTIADTVLRQVETVQDTVSETLFEPVIRIGVTGLARAGKTVFITSLVANLLDRGRMPHLVAESEGRIEAAFLQPQPDDTVPRFEYESHLGNLTAQTPRWPDSTRAVSELRLSLRVRRGGLLSGLQGPKTIHLDIVDYPGEWLLDLALLDKTYAQWSAEVLARTADRAEARAWHGLVAATDPSAPLEETQAQALAAGFTAYLTAARDAGYYDCTPGRFLLPGDLAGSPVLTFAPLPGEGAGPRGSLLREMTRRFEAYKKSVVRPFFQDHFARIDRQVVLVDALGAIHRGPRAVEDMRGAMADILAAFRPGQNAFLTRLFQGRRVEKILFAATKADHLHHSQHARLTAIMEALVRGASDRAAFAGAKTSALAIAALRATTEETLTHQGETMDVVRGRLLESGKQAAFYPGALPEDPGQLLTPAREGAEKWLDQDYRVMNFAPQPLTLRSAGGPPHIRLDHAAQFLLGDRL
ncbi:YcjX family protein [uncultured Roseobacter sp.]|uniref:YcjX family protein n=1 Tax=uncultured Roseobacter sp. TaxID=114847 RepID=UPI00261837F4|nr:YcjX family protein [uncultured Roseobacter sp.]